MTVFRNRLIALFLLFACTAHAEDKLTLSTEQIEALGVTVITLDSNASQLFQSYPARVVLAPEQERVVSSAVNAMVTSVLVQDGVNVKTGQSLLELQSPELATLQLNLIQAVGKARLASAALEREQSLLAEGITPKRRLLEAQTEQQQAQAALTLARASLTTVGMGTAVIKRIENSGAPETSFALSAPTDGVVNELEVHPGQQVASTDVLLRLVRLTPVWLELQLPLNSSVHYQPGMQLEVGAPPVKAKLVSVAAVAGDNQTLLARAVMESEPSQPLRPGQALEARLKLADQGWLLPQTALVRQDNQTYVFVRTKTGFEAKQVSVVSSSDQNVLLKGELNPGDKIASSKTIALKGVWLGESGMGEE